MERQGGDDQRRRLWSTMLLEDTGINAQCVQTMKEL